MSEPMTSDELRAAREWCMRNGPSNCWTGTLGTAAALVKRLLDERERLLKERDNDHE